MRPNNIRTASISRCMYLTFYQFLLQWLILGTPSSIWNFDCTNMNIIRCESDHVAEQHISCRLVQARSLPIGALFAPYHQHSDSFPLTQPYMANRMTLISHHDSSHSTPFKEPTQTTTDKSLPTQLSNNSTSTLPPINKPRKLGPILDHKQLKARIAITSRTSTYRDKLYHSTKQHPLSHCWSDIIPHSLPVALNPGNSAKTQSSNNLRILGWKQTSPTLNSGHNKAHPLNYATLSQKTI